MQIIYIACFISVIAFLTIYTINRKTDKENELITNYYQAMTEIRNDRSEEGLRILKNI